MSTMPNMASTMIQSNHPFGIYISQKMELLAIASLSIRSQKVATLKARADLFGTREW